MKILKNETFVKIMKKSNSFNEKIYFEILIMKDTIIMILIKKIDGSHTKEIKQLVNQEYLLKNDEKCCIELDY